jgi:dihydrofolate reductase
VDKYVVSSTLDEPGWDNSTILRGDLIQDVRALKSAPGGDIVRTGSVRLVHALVAARIVDEFRLFTYPVVLGHGARLFDDATELGKLRLVETQPFRSGVVLTGYRT